MKHCDTLWKRSLLAPLFYSIAMIEIKISGFSKFSIVWYNDDIQELEESH